MNLSSTVERAPNPTLRACSVRLTRQLDAGPERIFAAWLDATAAGQFLFAGPNEDAVLARIDARVGGGFRIVRHRDGAPVPLRSPVPPNCFSLPS